MSKIAEVLRHTCGWPVPEGSEPYRNHFVADEDHRDFRVLEQARELGLMRRGEAPSSYGYPRWIYVVTEEGFRFLGADS